MKENNQQSVIGRIKYLIKLSGKSQAEFARMLSIDPSNLSKHLSGKLAVSDALINRIVVDMGVSKQWLKDGEDLPFSKNAGVALPVVDMLQEHGRRADGIPVYDIDVTAGCTPLEAQLTADRITGYVSLPRLSPDTLIVRVSGDSMTPDIIDGGMIALRPVVNTDTIFWGQIYVVVTDDFRLVKYVRRHPTNHDKVILHSANPNYDDMEVNRDDIRAMFRVEAIINCKICG
ncbi:MAG: XRE family transcriptional regulator [Muribaculaceae bacterium]|nr:XRE family transcriptional regulator [Muribaculaceae bacterium]